MTVKVPVKHLPRSPKFQPSLLKKAIAGEKTQTRRTGKLPYPVGDYYLNEQVEVIDLCGDRATIRYFDGIIKDVIACPEREKYRLSVPVVGKNRGRSPIPKEWARYVFSVVEQSYEDLQDIAESDAIEEGVEIIQSSMYTGIFWKDYLDSESFCLTARESFRTLWNSVPGNTKSFAWEANPRVQKLTFTIKPMEK